MKTVTVRDLQKKVKDCVDDAQEDRVIITRRGRPAAVLIGVEDKDWEAVVLQTDPAFWKLIRRRRRQPTLSLDEIRSKIGTPKNADSRRFNE
jgi:prevent-host-death family protein